MATNPINGISSSEPARLQSVSSPRQASAANESASTDDEAVTVDTFPSSPPPEVMDAIAAASSAFDELAAQGMTVSFGTDEHGQFAALLQDKDGRTLSTLKPSEVLALADGTTPDQTGMSEDVNDQYQRDQ